MKNLMKPDLSLDGLADKNHMLLRLVEMAIHPLEKHVSADIPTLRSAIRELMEEDPFLQAKLERLIGLLEKRT
jgi:hypothetical protein